MTHVPNTQTDLHSPALALSLALASHSSLASAPYTTRRPALSASVGTPSDREKASKTFNVNASSDPALWVDNAMSPFVGKTLRMTGIQIIKRNAFNSLIEQSVKHGNVSWVRLQHPPVITSCACPLTRSLTRSAPTTHPSAPAPLSNSFVPLPYHSLHLQTFEEGHPGTVSDYVEHINGKLTGSGRNAAWITRTSWLENDHKQLFGFKVKDDWGFVNATTATKTTLVMKYKSYLKGEFIMTWELPANLAAVQLSVLAEVNVAAATPTLPSNFVISGTHNASLSGTYTQIAYVCNGLPVYQKGGSDGLVLFQQDGYKYWHVGSAAQATTASGPPGTTNCGYMDPIYLTSQGQPCQSPDGASPDGAGCANQWHEYPAGNGIPNPDDCKYPGWDGSPNHCINRAVKITGASQMSVLSSVAAPVAATLIEMVYSETYHYSTSTTLSGTHDTCYDGSKDQVELAVKYANRFSGYNDKMKQGNCYNAGFVQDEGVEPATKILPYTVSKWTLTKK